MASDEVDAVVPILLQRSALMPEVSDAIIAAIDRARKRGSLKPIHICWVAPRAADANREKLVKLYPLRRLGLPEDVAPMVALLASPHSGWITGQVLSISGGYSMV